jgi:hypothetical protein
MGTDLMGAVKDASGLKGLVLLTCGPAWTVPTSYAKLLSLVTT